MVLPFIARTTSPGRWARRPGMFSVAGTIPHTLTFGRSAAIAFIAPMTQAPPDMSLFIVNMPEADFISSPPLSNVIPFPSKPKLLAGVVRVAVVAHHDELGRLVRPLRHASERAHAHALYVGAVEHRQRHAGFVRRFQRYLRHARGRHVVGGFVAHVAREVDGVGDGATVRDAALYLRQPVAAELHDGRGFERGRLGVGLVLVERVRAEQDSLRGGAGAAVNVQAADAGAVQDGGEGGEPPAARESGDVGVDVPRGVDVERGGVPQPGDDRALGGRLAERVDERDVSPARLHVAFGNQVGYRAVERRIHRARRAARMRHALEQVDDRRRVLALRDIPVNDSYLHERLPVRICPLGYMKIIGGVNSGLVG